VATVIGSPSAALAAVARGHVRERLRTPRGVLLEVGANLRLLLREVPKAQFGAGSSVRGRGIDAKYDVPQKNSSSTGL
jgi:hypothetical protein